MKLLHVVTCIILSMCTSCNLLIALFNTIHASEMMEERPCIIYYFSMILRESIDPRLACMGKSSYLEYTEESS